MKKTSGSNLKVPTLQLAGIGNKFLILVEVLRHPNGLSTTESSDKFPCADRTTLYHLDKLLESGLVEKKYELRGSKVEAVFYISPFGVDKIHEEMRCLCEIMAVVRKEIIKNKVSKNVD
jgi:predicted transcriptional regulator